MGASSRASGCCEPRTARGPGINIMKRVFGSFLSFGLVALALAAPAQNETRIDPRAERILRAACDYLAETPQFSITAEIWRDHVYDSGQKVQFARTADLQVKRPNRLHAEFHSSHTQRAFWYDGKVLTELDRKRNLFCTSKVPGTIDGAIDTAEEELGLDLPLIDLAISDPYKNAVARVTQGIYFGLSPAMGFQCHHLAFTQDNVDWQVWIEDGPQPLIRKFVITHKNESGAPEFTALIKAWDLVNRIAESAFVFDPPSGAVKIDRLKSGSPESNPRSGKVSEPLASPKQKS